MVGLGLESGPNRFEIGRGELGLDGEFIYGKFGGSNWAIESAEEGIGLKADGL